MRTIRNLPIIAKWQSCNHLFLILISVLVMGTISLCACAKGTIPEPLREPAQEAVEQAVKAPGIDLYVNIRDLTSSGLNVGVEARIDNPNPVTLDIGNLQVVTRGKTGQTYIQDTMPGGSVAPNSSRTLSHSIVIPLNVLSERSMTVTVDGRAGAAGITLPISATITVTTLDLQNLVSAPGIALSVNIGKLSSNGLRTDLQANINNPNAVSLDIGNLQMVMKGQGGNVITTSTMIGGSIAPKSSGTFTSDLVIPLEVLNERSIIVTADTKAGVAGITLPVTATVTVNMPDIQSLISAPGIDLYVDMRDLSPSGLNVAIEARISNPNPITLDIGNLQVVAKGETGYSYVRDTITGHSIGANSSRSFTSNIVIPFDVLNERKMITTVDTRAGVAGITLPITATVTVNIPDIQNIITAPQVTIYADPTIVATFPLPSLRILIDTTITNSNNFGLIIGHLHINMFRSDGALIKQMTMSGGIIQAFSSQMFSSSVTLGPEVLSLIGSSYLRIKVDSEVGISSINDRIPIGSEFILVLPHLP